MSTLKVLKSQVVGINFADEVARHAQELRWHAERTPDMHTTPAPVARELVDRAVRRPDMVADYEIVDDVSPTLEQRKLAHEHAVTTTEIEAAERAFPRRKRQLSFIKHAAAMAKVKTDDKGKVRDGRSPEEKKHCDDHDQRVDSIREIEAHAAQMRSDIDDLTNQNIGAWKSAPFPES